MMNFGLSNFFLAFFLFCNNVISANSYTCHNDTQTLNEILLGGGNGTYHICANTTIDVGVFDEQTDGVVNGSLPIRMVNSGIKVLCGENGSVENNCVFRNGETGFEIINKGIISPPRTGMASLTDLHIEGFTFTGLKLPILSFYPFLVQVGVTVKNCKFIDNLNANSLIKIQTEVTMSPDQVVVEDSHFIGNSIAPPFTSPDQQGSVFVGLIEVPYSARVSVSNSKFMNNTFHAPLGTNIVVEPFRGVRAGHLNVTNSCFVENKNSTLGLIFVTHSNTGGFMIGNHNDTNDFKEGLISCEGLVVLEQNKLTCNVEGFNKSECSIPMSPTAAPTTSGSISMSPTAAPTTSSSISMSPTAAPTTSSSISMSPTAAPTTSSSISMSPTARVTIMILSSVFSVYLL